MKNLSQFSNLVDSIEIARTEMIEFFEPLTEIDSDLIWANIKERTIGSETAIDDNGDTYKVTSYECYIDSGSEDYYYFQLAVSI